MLNYFLLIILLCFELEAHSEKKVNVGFTSKEILKQKLETIEEKSEEKEIFYDAKENFSNSLENSEEEEIEDNLLECKPSLLNKLFCIFLLISPCFASKYYVTPRGPPLNSLLKIQNIHHIEQRANNYFNRQNSINSNCQEKFQKNKKIYECKALIDKNKEYEIKLEKNGKNLFIGEIKPKKECKRNICKNTFNFIKKIKKSKGKKHGLKKIKKLKVFKLLTKPSIKHRDFK
ncbi:hypothetical protein ACQ4LE_007471 [Meloidogyne hapla]